MKPFEAVSLLSTVAITGHQFRYDAYLDWCPVSFYKVLDLQGFSLKGTKIDQWVKAGTG